MQKDTPGLCLQQPGEDGEPAQGLEAQGSETLRSARKGSAGRGSLAPKLSVLLPLGSGEGLRVMQRPPHLLQVPVIHVQISSPQGHPESH